MGYIGNTFNMRIRYYCIFELEVNPIDKLNQKKSAKDFFGCPNSGKAMIAGLTGAVTLKMAWN